MTLLPHRRRRRTTLGLAAVTAILVPGLAQLPALATDLSATSGSRGDAVAEIATIGDPVPGLDDLDVRGSALPRLAQRRAAARLGAVDLRWNDFGTPSSILPADGVLARATSSDPVRAARTWLADNAAVFGLPRSAMADLELVSSQPFAMSSARAVLFRQRFGGLTPALGSMVTVGVADGQIAYASSSLVRTTQAPPAAKLSLLDGWLAAARNVGRTDLDVDGIVSEVEGGWTRLTVPGFAQEQQVRLRALALADGTVRPVLEANVVDVANGSAFAYTLLVDAVDGSVLHRQNQVENSSDAFQFTGTITATECGPKHPFELTDNATKQIAATSFGSPTDDHVVKIFKPSGELLTSGDLGTNPEYALYTADSIPRGIYSVQVCPFSSPTVPVVVGPYAALVTTSDTAAPSAGAETPSPRWRFFTGNPTLDSPRQVPTNSVIGCWIREAGCSLPTGPLRNVASPAPWDHLTNTGASTFTTLGNNASTREAWGSPLTPGGLFQGPVSPTQDYTDPFQDRWNNSRCDPAELRPGGNDINASVTNLFVSHNRMHDYSYYLGFNERNYNLQIDNIGRGGAEGDPEVGNAQAGALTGAPYATGLGRDNANQITLQDGVPGITNQYLFQPLAGAFYAPCTDGGLDMGIVGHEYTHAISNRMVGGPDEGLTSEQGGAMGESWSDLVAAEYMFSHGYSNGGNVWAVGVYATGNKNEAIRDYAINKNPLNYSNYGFDTTGDEVHADGEIWNGANWSVRQALVKKWNRDPRFRYGKKELQLNCAQGQRNKGVIRPQKCPGNRRWVQLVFDSFLLQQGATSFLDARDAMIAADKMRFRGENKKVIWDAFAKRGMGKGASSPSVDSGDTVPSFASPTSRNATVTFRTPGAGNIYVGHYEARSTPVADTKGGTKLDQRATFAPGTYRMLYVSPTHGFKRFSMTVRPGQRTTVKVGAARNLAARSSGAKVIGATAGSRNPVHLIDGTENTNWGGVTETNVSQSNPFVAVDLAGGTHRIGRLQVSAMLTPSTTGDDGLPLARVDEDPDSGSRFTALRKFAIEACTSSCSSADAVWKRVYVSADDAFPSVRPRPVAPTLTMRTFAVKPFRAAAVRLVTVHNQCTGNPAYQGELDSDPLNSTDCDEASDRGTIVHAAELQVFAR